MHCLYFICERTHARKNYATLEINPMENVNKQRRNFISLSELWYDPLEFNFRRVRLTDKVSGRKNRDKDWKNANSLFPQIVDVLVADASLDLKVPIVKYAALFSLEFIVQKITCVQITKSLLRLKQVSPKYLNVTDQQKWSLKDC